MASARGRRTYDGREVRGKSASGGPRSSRPSRAALSGARGSQDTRAARGAQPARRARSARGSQVAQTSRESRGAASPSRQARSSRPPRSSRASLTNQVPAGSRASRRRTAQSGTKASIQAPDKTGKAAQTTRATSGVNASDAMRDEGGSSRFTTIRGGRSRGAGSVRGASGSSDDHGSQTQISEDSRRQQQKDHVSYTSKSVEELRRADKAKQARKTARGRILRAVIAVVVVVGVTVGAFALYNSSAFTIENVNVNGVEHLTSSEMTQLANVSPDTTLLRVDTDTISNRLKQSAWVEDVQINRVFPSTLEINVTEREVAAIVEIPTSSSAVVKNWAIAKDHLWLMPIPDASSDAAKTTSAKIYEDEQNSLHIVDIPFGTKAAIGEMCTDANVNNALDVVAGMTTELADRIVEVSAAGTAETTLVLDNGVEIAFGKAEDIRDKERVVLEILAENPDNVSYINVRMVETPTWRAI